jgi:peptidoglycan/LPS O-acetylase OafA/YrhL
VIVSLHTHLRRRRRRLLVALALLAVALAALTAHAAAMDGAMGDHVMSDAAALCLAVGGSLAAIGVRAFAARRMPQRSRWVIPAFALPAPLLLPAAAGVLVRAGPPRPASLQVFRL